MMKTERMIGASCPGLQGKREEPKTQPENELIDVNKLQVCVEPSMAQTARVEGALDVPTHSVGGIFARIGSRSC